jgi:hypothetical protein
VQGGARESTNRGIGVDEKMLTLGTIGCVTRLDKKYSKIMEALYQFSIRKCHGTIHSRIMLEQETPPKVFSTFSGIVCKSSKGMSLYGRV